MMRRATEGVMSDNPVSRFMEVFRMARLHDDLMGDDDDDDIALPDLNAPNVYACHDAAISRVNLLAGIYDIVSKPAVIEIGPLGSTVFTTTAQALIKSIDELMSLPLPGK